MSYKGMPIFPQQELTSVRRLREAGVKGMKWGVHNDKIHKALEHARRHANNVGYFKGTVAKLDKIMDSAKRQGGYSKKHMDAVAGMADKHDMNRHSTARGNLSRQVSDNLNDALGHYEDSL